MTNCTTCGPLQEGWEIDRSMPPGDRKEYFEHLGMLDEVKHGTLYRCPECGMYFYHSFTQEWDSFDEVMVHVEKLYPLDEERAGKIIDPGPPNPPFGKIVNPGHCSKCHSGNIRKLRETKINREFLVWCRCLECGNEEFMDTYEDPDLDC